MNMMEYDDLVIQKYNKFLVDNYLIFLPPVIHGNGRYIVEGVQSEFYIDGYFHVRYAVKDLWNGGETQAEVTLFYDLVTNAYNRWYEPEL